MGNERLSYREALFETLMKLAIEYGVDINEVSKNQFLIKGSLTVNYYPYSTSRKAWVIGTTISKRDVTPFDAIKMAIQPPPIANKFERDKRKNRNRETRKKLLIKCDRCRWCGCPLALNTCTLEHIIPLARGGLDEWENYALACSQCNQRRGSDMPELCT